MALDRDLDLALDGRRSAEEAGAARAAELLSADRILSDFDSDTREELAIPAARTLPAAAASGPTATPATRTGAATKPKAKKSNKKYDPHLLVGLVQAMCLCMLPDNAFTQPLHTCPGDAVRTVSRYAGCAAVVSYSAAVWTHAQADMDRPGLLQTLAVPTCWYEEHEPALACTRLGMPWLMDRIDAVAGCEEKELTAMRGESEVHISQRRLPHNPMSLPRWSLARYGTSSLSMCTWVALCWRDYVISCLACRDLRIVPLRECVSQRLPGTARQSSCVPAGWPPQRQQADKMHTHSFSI